MNLDLAVIMPVYNEDGCIEDVVRDWLNELDGLGVCYLIIVIDDGSRDKTAQKLEQFRGDSRIQLVKKPNTGHGPTILSGYREAVQIADWVFQCDSDNEIPAQCFRNLWEKRIGVEAVLGYRFRTTQSLQRKIVSWIARGTVVLLFGRGIQDVNVPYRLVEAGVLSQIISKIPDDTFAPNVIISGALVKGRFDVLNVPVKYQPRTTGQVSIVSWKLYKAAATSFWQTLRVLGSL